MANSDTASMPQGPERSLLLRLRESGDALEAFSPPFDTAAGAARLREVAQAHGFLRTAGALVDDLAVTGVELEEDAPPFDVEAGADRLWEAARARSLLSGGSSEDSWEVGFERELRDIVAAVKLSASDVPRISSKNTDLRTVEEDARLLSGPTTAEYAMVYRAEIPQLMSYLIKCGANWHDAEDAAQHALIALYNQWETVRNRRVWLRKVAFREFMRASGTNEYPQEGHDQLSTPSHPADIESLLAQDAVLSAIRQVPLLQRQVFALHFDQLTTSEIADALQISEAAVRQNLARARARLKELLGIRPSKPERP